MIQNSSDLTTQKMVISDVFECTKGKIPLLTKKDFLVQYRTTVTAGFDVSEAEVEETRIVQSRFRIAQSMKIRSKLNPTTSHYMIRILQC